MLPLPMSQSLDLSDNPALTWRSCLPLAELVDTSRRLGTVHPKHEVVGCGECRLATLVLNGLPVGGRGVELLATKLSNNRHLTTLGLQRVGLQRSGAVALSQMLQENITLQVGVPPCAASPTISFRSSSSSSANECDKMTRRNCSSWHVLSQRHSSKRPESLKAV